MARRPAVSPLDLDALLCFAVHSTGFAFNRIYRQALQSLGLTYPQYLVMVALWGEDGVTVGHLGELLRLDTSTLTPLLKRLEALGLLSRVRSKADERRVVVGLTNTGRAMRHKAAEVRRCVVKGAGLSADELARLTRELRVLRTNLERAAAPRAGLRRSARLAPSQEAV